MVKRNTALIVLFINLIFAFTGCIKEVDTLNYEDPAPVKLFVFCAISPGDRIVVRVMKTKPFFNSSNFNELVKNANVILNDDSKSVTLKYVPIISNIVGYYFGKEDPLMSYYVADTGAFQILPGQTYHLTIKTLDGLSVTAHCTVPNEVIFEGVKRMDPIQTDSLSTIYPFEIDWDLGRNIVQCSFTAYSSNKLINLKGDTVVYKQERDIGWLIHPDQFGNKFTGRFSEAYRSKEPYFERKIQWIDIKIYDKNMYEAFIKNSFLNKNINASFINPEDNRFFFRDDLLNLPQTQISLPYENVVPGSVTVYALGIVLKQGVDYTIDYSLGIIKIINPYIAQSKIPITYTIRNENGVIERTDPANLKYDPETIPFEDNLFSEPSNHFTNIEGGFGIFGAYTSSKVPIGN